MIFQVSSTQTMDRPGQGLQSVSLCWGEGSCSSGSMVWSPVSKAGCGGRLGPFLDDTAPSFGFVHWEASAGFVSFCFVLMGYFKHLSLVLFI